MEKISDRELREKLSALGYDPPPVTDTSRDLLVKKLKKLQSLNPTNNYTNSYNDVDKNEQKSKKTRSIRSQDIKIDYTSPPPQSQPPPSEPRSYNDDVATRQTRSSRYNENKSFEKTDSPRKSRKTSSFMDYSPSRNKDPFEKSSDSEESSLSYSNHSSSTRSNLARKPLNMRRESEFYTSVRTPSFYNHKIDAGGDFEINSYLNRDINRGKLLNSGGGVGGGGGNKVDSWTKIINKFSLNKITPSIVLLAFVAFFVIVAGIYYTKNDRVYSELRVYDMSYPKCTVRGRPGISCVPDIEMDDTLNCLKAVYRSLYKTGMSTMCGNSKSEARPTLTRHNVIELLVHEMGLLRYEADKMVTNLKVLSKNNPQLKVVWSDKDDAFHLESLDLPWHCVFRYWMSVLVDYAFYVSATVALLFSMHILFRWGIMRHQEHAKSTQDLVKGIIGILQQNAITNPSQNYLPIVHVRDQLISFTDRERKKKMWMEAVKYIEENESRIRKEVQLYQGEDYDVWRWLGGGNQLSSPKPKTWQGEAFETSKDTMNTPSTSPTPCLKIRNMFNPDDVIAEEDWVNRVKDAILERCGVGVNIVHMSVDETSKEGCVFIKCASVDDSGIAYRRMHGAWYDGKIVCVKYLRLERYHERFPSSIGLTESLEPSNDQKRSIA